MGFPLLQGRRSSNLLWAAGANDRSLSIPTSKTQSPKRASRNSHLLTKAAGLTVSHLWLLHPEPSFPAYLEQKVHSSVSLAALTNIPLPSLCWWIWCSLHFSRRPLGCRACKGKEWIGTHVQQLKCCPQLNVKITADITVPARTEGPCGAGQADVFGEWLKEDGYF